MEGGLGFDVSMIMICVLVLTFLYLFCGSNEREIDATARPKARVIVQDKFCNKSVEPVSVEAAKVRARFELTSSSAVTIDSSVILSSISDDGNGRNFSNSSSSDSSNSSSSSSGYQLNGNWRKIINVLREVGNVFIISKGTDDELNKSNITSLLDSIGFPKHRLLVCDTEKGKIAIVRQLVPRIHIDSDRNFISTVSPHIPYAIEVKGPPAFFSCEALI